MSVAPDQIRCRHIFTEGRQCGRASLRHEHFCYYHHTARLPAPRPPRASLSEGEDFDFPLPEDRSAVQRALGEVLRRIAADRIDLKRAGMLLYGLALASANLPREAAQPRPAAQSRPVTPRAAAGRPAAGHNTHEHNAPEAHEDHQEHEATELDEAPVTDVVMDPEHGPLAPSNQPLTPGQSLVSPAAFRHIQNQAIAKAVTDDLDNLARKYPNPPAPYPPTATPNSPHNPASSQSTPASPRPSYPVPTFPPHRLLQAPPTPRKTPPPNRAGCPMSGLSDMGSAQPQTQTEPQSQTQSQTQTEALHQAQAEAGAASLARLLAIHPPPNP